MSVKVDTDYPRGLSARHVRRTPSGVPQGRTCESDVTATVGGSTLGMVPRYRNEPLFLECPLHHVARP